MKKRILSLALAAMMLVTLFTACSSASSSAPAASSAPASSGSASTSEATSGGMDTSPITLSIMNRVPAEYIVENNHVLDEIERITGVRLEVTAPPIANYTDRMQLAMASGDIPDIIYTWEMDANYEKFANDGLIMPLDKEKLAQYPNLQANLNQDQWNRALVGGMDGEYYAIPRANAQSRWAVIVNQKWLDNLGLEAPTTVDELYDVLVAFRDNDPNGNGQKDEIPYCVVGKDYPHRMFYDLLGSWGFGINGVMDSDYAFSWLDIDDAGKVRFIGREDKFKNMVEFYNKLWTEGLVDKESYSQDQTQAAAKVNAGQVGFVARAQNTQWMGAAAENYVQCPVLEGPYGDRALINVESNVQMTGVAVITTANKYPEATMRWLDYFYSEEGTVLCRLGIEGESYEVVDGKYQLLDNIKNNPDGLTLDQALGQWAIFPGGYLPQYITNEVDQSAAQLPETKAANDVVRDYVVPFETVPRVKFTEEESIKLGTYAQDIVNYATENVVKFITGEKSLSEWDAYVAELNNMPVEDYIKINQDAYDRWKG